MIGEIKYEIFILKFVNNTERKEDGPNFFVINLSILNMILIKVVIEYINNINTFLLQL